MVITILSQDSPTPMLIFFPHNWTKPSWEIFSRLYRVCDQQSRSWITKLIGTQPQHPKNQVHSQNNCTYALNASLNSKQTALGESQFVSAVEINISWLCITGILTPFLSPLSDYKIIHIDSLHVPVWAKGFNQILWCLSWLRSPVRVHTFKSLRTFGRGR